MPMNPGGFSFETVIVNLAGEAEGISYLLSAVAYAGGIFCVLMSFLLARRAADGSSRGQPKMGWLWSLAIGTALIALPTTIASVAATMFGSTTTTDLTFGYTHNAAGPRLAAMVPLLKVIGVIAVIRGLFVLRAVGIAGEARGNVTFARGITLIGAGVLAVHMKSTLQLFSTTTGLNLGAGLF